MSTGRKTDDVQDDKTTGPSSNPNLEPVWWSNLTRIRACIRRHLWPILGAPRSIVGRYVLHPRVTVPN